MMSITMKSALAGLVLTASLIPAQVFAWQKHRESTSVTVTKDPQLLNKGPIAPPSFVHPAPIAPPRPFVHRSYPYRSFGYGGTVIYSVPPGYYAAPYSYDPPAMYYVAPPTTTYSSPPPAATPPLGASTPTPGVIEYPHGRYELHGDGVNAPYTWVWIPNTSSPVPPAPVPVPPAPATPPEPSASGASRTQPSGPLYRWVDEQGSVHWTDRFDTIPERYRPGAQQIQPS